MKEMRSLHDRGEMLPQANEGRPIVAARSIDLRAKLTWSHRTTLRPVFGPRLRFTRFALRACVAAPRVARRAFGLPSRSSRTRKPAFAFGSGAAASLASRQSVFAFAALQLRRTRFTLRACVAAPRVSRRAKRGGPGRTRTCNQTVMSGRL